METKPPSRRRFLRQTMIGVAGLAVWPHISANATDSKTPEPQWGVCYNLDGAQLLKQSGFDFMECGVSSLLVPDKSDAEFEIILAKLQAAALPVRSCNGFIPGELKLTGPEPKTDAAVAYAEKALARAGRAGIPYIVLGSGKARAVPEGFDLKQAREQFVTFCRRIGPAAVQSKVTVVLEPLNRKETNFFHSVAEGAGMVDEINHPGIQLMADIYHMLRENESPDAIRQAGRRVRHCHIAEKEKRTPPGRQGDDFKPYFRAFKDIGYTGGVSIEASAWAKEPTAEMSLARKVLSEQWNAA